MIGKRSNQRNLPPEKSLFRIGEVSRLTATKPFVLRYWETEFPMLQPVKSPKGHRLYRREDVETVLLIKRLLYDEGFTIAGRAAAPARRSARFAELELDADEIRRRGEGPARHAKLHQAAGDQPQDVARPARLAPRILDAPRNRVIR